MIHRIIYHDWPLIFPFAALFVAVMVAAAAAWRTAAMKPAPADQNNCPPDTDR